MTPNAERSAPHCYGEDRIRTCGPLRVSGFQDRRLQPLGHLSAVILRPLGPHPWGDLGHTGGSRVTPCTPAGGRRRDHWRARASMAREYKLRLGDGTVLAVDEQGLRTWVVDANAAVQSTGSQHWRPLKEVLAEIAATSPKKGPRL